MAQKAPSAPQAPPPAYEMPTWSQQPHRVSFTNSFTSSALQQLWLSCPDSFSQLLAPAAFLGLSTHPKSHSRAHDHHESQKSMSGATEKLAAALQQHSQMVACGNSNASVAMLHDLTAFLEAFNMQSSAVSEASKVPAAAASSRPANQGSSHRAAESAQVQAADRSEASAAASGAIASAALQVLSVLIAHDKACQQVVVQAMDPAKAAPQVIH